MTPWRTLLAALCAGASLCRAEPPPAGGPPTERELKAAVAFNILQFVTWPAAALPADRSLVLCVPEAGESARFLARYHGMRVREGQLSVRQLDRRLDGLGECQAVFVDAGNPYALLQIAAASRERPILVIAEGDHALQEGAGMAVSLAGNHVVIDVNLLSLEASGLNVSSKLLRLARRVIK